MDFELSLMISGLLVSVTIYLGLLIYGRRLKSVYNDVSRPTANALVLFGIANAFMGLMGISGVLAPEYSMIWIAFMFSSLLLTELNLIITNESTIKRIAIIVLLLAIGVMIDGLASIFLGTQRIIMMPVLAVLIIGTTGASLYLLKETPNPFTGSIFTVIVLLLTAAFTAQTGIVASNPEYFIIQMAPMTVAAAVLLSMLRPWRHIISYTIVLLAFVVGTSLAIPAYLDGDTSILIFSIVAAFAGTATVIPLDFFIRQATETKASTPLYISLTLFFVALLAITHSNNYAISLSTIGIWDPNILFVDWFFGIFGVAAFIMAALSASASEQTRMASRETLLAYGCILLTLGHPFVINERYTLNVLYIGVIIPLIIGFVSFLNVVYKLSKAGAAMAGARFLAFMFASLFLGIIAMFADVIDINIIAILMVTAGLLMIGSSPRASIIRNRD